MHYCITIENTGVFMYQSHLLDEKVRFRTIISKTGSLVIAASIIRKYTDSEERNGKFQLGV